MKSTTGWPSGWNGNNSSGFAGLPAAYRTDYNGSFYDVGLIGNWWSAIETSISGAWSRSLAHSDSYVSKDNGNKKCGFSVRVVKD